MDCGIAAPSRIAAGSLLKKQAAGIKHSKRAIETGGQRHGALLRTAYSGIRSRRVEAACAVSNSTAPADLVEREVVAVLQDLPGTTFNTLLATLAKSSSGHKISHAELSQALDNLSRRGFVIKDNRGNVKLSKSALTFSPISPPAPNTEAEDAVARQAIPPETCDEAATAEELQQEILNILEGAPGMTASSLHAQLTKAMRTTIRIMQLLPMKLLKQPHAVDGFDLGFYCSDPPWSSQELGELLDRMSEAGRV
ncbi:hypothetical protein QJQ45_019215, partial [Haematococcus lacustris]